MKSIKWTVKKIQAEALKHKSRWDFQQFSSKAYKAAYKRKILDQVCSHMLSHSELISGENNPAFKWTDEMLAQEALKYGTRTDFAKNSASAYRSAISRNILEAICGHMEWECYPWTNEELIQEALKYRTRGEFQEGNRKAYDAARGRDILDEICCHMLASLTEQYSDEELVLEALKYKTRGEFQSKSAGAYVVARIRGILDRICSHMEAATNTSSPEKALMKIIQSYYPTARKLIDRKADIEDKPYIWGFDLDIFVLELGLAIEFDGKYYHSFKGLKRGRKHWPDSALRQYHEIKDAYFLSKGIKILHIKEVDWNVDKQACVQRCLDFLASGVLSEVA